MARAGPASRVALPTTNDQSPKPWPSSVVPGPGDAFGHEALGKGEEDQGRKDDHRGSCEYRERGAAAILPLEGDDANRQRHPVRRCQEEIGPEELVPCGLEREDRQGGDGRPGERDDDLEQDAKMTGPVDAGAVLDFARN